MANVERTGGFTNACHRVPPRSTAAVHAFLENDAATTRGLPQVRVAVPPQLPVGLQVPVVVSVWAEAGEDFDPHFFIVARDPNGEIRGRIERLCHWPDLPGKPFKFQVFTEYLQLIVRSVGFYRIGLYDQPEGTETDFWFPLEIYVSPLAAAPRTAAALDHLTDVFA